MKFGLRPIEGGDDFTRTIDQVVEAEELGFDSVWLAEHYSGDDHWWPASLVNLAALAARTGDIRLGTNVLITPFYNPVWLASSVAMLDTISEGRFVCGLGVGYDRSEFAVFDASLDDRVDRTIETIILLKKLWTEDEVTFDGKFYTLEEFGISPKPRQTPHPPIWFGVWGDYLLSQAAKRADAWIPGAVADVEQLRERKRIYSRHLDGERPEEQPLLRDIVIGDSEAEAKRRAERYLREKYEVYAGRNHEFFDQYESEEFDQFIEDRIIVGTPDSCIEQIERYVDVLGIDHLIFRFNYNGMSAPDVHEDMRTIASEIMASFD